MSRNKRSDALCRVLVYRTQINPPSHEWAVVVDTRVDGAGADLVWVGGMMERYLRGKRHPSTLHEVHVLLYGVMGSVPDEVEVLLNDYEIPPVRRGDMAHLAHRMEYGSLESVEKMGWAKERPLEMPPLRTEASSW